MSQEVANIFKPILPAKPEHNTLTKPHDVLAAPNNTLFSPNDTRSTGMLHSLPYTTMKDPHIFIALAIMLVAIILLMALDWCDYKSSLAKEQRMKRVEEG